MPSSEASDVYTSQERASAGACGTHPAHLGPQAGWVPPYYRQPFELEADRWPTLNWPREIPIDGAPAQMIRLVEEYGEWLSTSEVPKLFVNADPGSILIGRQREFCRRWPNQTEVTVKGSHFLQEDSPVEIGQAVARWLAAL